MHGLPKLGDRENDEYKYDGITKSRKRCVCCLYLKNFNL